MTSGEVARYKPSMEQDSPHTEYLRVRVQELTRTVSAQRDEIKRLKSWVLSLSQEIAIL